MEHGTLLLTIVLGLVLALAFGFLASKLHLPPLVGYLVAGILVGPYAPGVSIDVDLATQLSEIGVILLMFGVGLHFSTADLLAVRWVAVPGAVGQIVIATAVGAAVAATWGWSLGGGIVLGLALSVASTVVLLRALDERNVLRTANGRIAVGWLIVEDLAVVLALVLLPAVAGMLGDAQAGAGGGGFGTRLLMALGWTLGKVAVFGGLILTVGPRLVPWMLSQAARTGSHELFTLSVLAVALGIAYGSARFFDVSFALGAFAAGIVLAKSELSHRAAAESLPLQNAFAVLFFVSVGMLFDPAIVVREPLEVAAVLLIIVVGKSIAAFVIVIALGFPVSTAAFVSASLAQVGEFSFILAGLGGALGLLPAEGKDLILAGALLSITLNPVAFALVKPLTVWINTLGLIARGEPTRRAHLAALDWTLAEVRQASEPGVNLGLQPARLVSRFPVFGDLDADQRAELLLLFKPRSAAPGERVIRAGDAGNEMFFISSGAVEVSIAGKKIHLGPGDFFGEMALLTGERRIADVTAIDYCLFLIVTKVDFDHFIVRYPGLRQKINEIATHRAEMNKQQAASSRPAR
jgi:CPA2 family monovalent cation:H+ antiporter-2